MKKNLRIYTVIIVLLAAAAFSLVSCTTEPPTPSPEASELPTIKLVSLDWMAHELNVQVARIILEDEMGYPVEVTQMEAGTHWQDLADGTVQADLEVWPGQPEDVQAMFDSGGVELGDRLGVIGKIGWFVPFYALRLDNSLNNWESLAVPENAALFASDETGDKGRFIAGPESWGTIDADIIHNLDLNFEVDYTDSEDDLLAKLDEAYQIEEPVLVYLWTPHWAHAVYDLAPVVLPDYSDECYAGYDTGEIDCDYPESILRKAFWPGLAELAPEAYEFLSNFEYTTQDQIAMMAEVQINGLTTAEAAQVWVDKNEDVWRAWLP